MSNHAHLARLAFFAVASASLVFGCAAGSGDSDAEDSGIGSGHDANGGGDGSPTSDAAHDGGTGGDTGPGSGKDTGHPGDGSGATDSGSSSGDTAGGGTDTGTTTPDTPPPTGSAPVIAGCKIFPDDNPWNVPVDTLPLSPDASTYATTMHLTTHLHADWGSFADEYGIPWNTGTGAPSEHMNWSTSWGPDESDERACTDGSGYKWCYPIPFSALIEGGTGASSDSDRHVLYIDTAGAPDHCTLYELWNTQNPPDSSGGWDAANGAIFPLGTNALRTDGWTSADAAGLPILPGLVRYDEVAAGEIKHAIRFTMNNTYNGYIHPATHAAGLSGTSYPPMGLRMRLKKGTTASLGSISAEATVILTAMEKYGILLADNGSNWYISGDTNDGWTSSVMDGIVSAFGKVTGSNFEAVDTGSVSTAGL